MYYIICPFCDHVMIDCETFNQIPNKIQCEFCGEHHDIDSILGNTYVNLNESDKKFLREKIKQRRICL